LRQGKLEELQTLCLSEKARYVTFIGRIKENASNLRRFHAAMAPEWDAAMDPEGDYVFALSGDLKYMLTMLGHAGASASYPCSCCVRSRKTLCFRSWIPEELATIKQMTPNAFHGDCQLRSYPASATCDHNVAAGTCFCVDKGAEYVQDYIDTIHEEHCEDFAPTDQHAPFHKAVVTQSREHTYSIVAPPLLKHIPMWLRFPGIWHCCHNTRQMFWIMFKDAAGAYGVIPKLQAAMVAIGLKHIKVAAMGKPRKEANIEAAISAENAAALKKAVDEEAKEDCNQRAGMDGNELEIVMDNLDVILGHFKSGVAPANSNAFERWGASVTRALKAFNKGTAIALADLWETNRAAEMGEKFRTFADEICGIDKSCGLPYVSREYLAILPIHWLCEPDHLQAQASKLFETYGVAPGSGTDATTEMVIGPLSNAIT
jgi:hypothetical protein